MAGRAFGVFDSVDGLEYAAPESSLNPQWTGPGDNVHPELIARTFTRFPAASDANRAIVHFALGAGVEPNRDILAKTEVMKAMLNEILPSWVDFRIIYSLGFILDLSLLDATGFGS